MKFFVKFIAFATKAKAKVKRNLHVKDDERKRRK